MLTGRTLIALQRAAPKVSWSALPRSSLWLPLRFGRHRRARNSTAISRNRCVRRPTFRTGRQAISFRARPPPPFQNEPPPRSSRRRRRRPRARRQAFRDSRCRHRLEAPRPLRARRRRAPPGQPANATLPQPANPPPQQPANTAPQPDDTVVTEIPTQKIPNERAVFTGLDKITGRIINFDAAINETVQFGALQVTPRACYTRPPTEPANTDAFLEVDEVTLQGEIKRIFDGWMFASSPGLHAIEHPIYDVWLTDCKSPIAAAPVAQQTPAPTQAAAPTPARQRPRQPARPAVPIQPPAVPAQPR